MITDIVIPQGRVSAISSGGKIIWEKNKFLTSYEFNTDGDFDGWNAGNEWLTPSVSGGALYGRTTGSFPYITNNSLGVSDAQQAGRIDIRFKITPYVETGVWHREPEYASIYFLTANDLPISEAKYDNSKRFVFPLGEKDNEGYYNCSIDTQYMISWAGEIVSVRLEPFIQWNSGQNYAGHANVWIDYIRIIKTPKGSGSYLTGFSWEFNQNAEAWPGGSIVVDGDRMVQVMAVSAGSQLYSPSISSDADTYKYLRMGIKNNSHGDTISIYFVANGSGPDEYHKVYCRVEPYSGYKEYVVHMGQCLHWTGVLNRIMLNTVGNGELYVDYIRLTDR